MKVLISGATGAVGSTLAAQLAAENTLLLTARDTQKLAGLAEQYNAQFIDADLCTAEGAARVQAFADQHGPVDAFVHCVGATVIKPLHLTSEADWAAQMELNATTAFRLLKWFVAQAVKAKRPGAAVLVSSVVAEAGFANHEAVAAAKAAVTALAQSAAATYADKGIRINVVAPGLTRSSLTARFVATPEAQARSAALIPTGRIGEPEDVASAIKFLLSSGAAHITGQVIRIDGGQGILRPLPRMPAASAGA
jgi:3-oxoacyl-[acyl-carrier protein] reductase